MTELAAAAVIALAVYAILRRAEVRLTLTLAALALGCLARQPEVIVRTFLAYFTSEQFLVPIGCCMGFAYVLKHTDCDRHLVQLLVTPLRKARVLFIPGAVLVGVLVNVPVISQASTTALVGAVLVPVMRGMGVSAVTTGACLALGASMGGELLNPGAPELGTVSSRAGASPVDCIARVWPLLLVHLAVTVPLFWWLSVRAERRCPPEGPVELAWEAEPIRLNLFKALVPLLPLALLFLTAPPEGWRVFTVPQDWLVSPAEKLPNPRASYNSRLIGASMLVGVAVAALTAPRRAAATAQVFFEGAGFALTRITAVIVAANCFGKGVELVGLARHLERAIATVPNLLYPLAAALPLGFAWVSGSGMASTQSLYAFFHDPAMNEGIDPLRIGAVVSLAAAAGRTMSPVAAVVLMATTLTNTEPLAVVRRVALPLLAGTAAVVVAAVVLG
jgi:DcuC family C4-dicarboxylate transporter